MKWNKCIGFDFQQDIEDKYPPLDQYTPIIDDILQKYDEISYSKVYQAGNSSDHLNKNIEKAL